MPSKSDVDRLKWVLDEMAHRLAEVRPEVALGRIAGLEDEASTLIDRCGLKRLAGLSDELDAQPAFKRVDALDKGLPVRTYVTFIDPAGNMPTWAFDPFDARGLPAFDPRTGKPTYKPDKEGDLEPPDKDYIDGLLAAVQAWRRLAELVSESPVPAAGPEPAQAPPQDGTHAADFTWFWWGGKRYDFTKGRQSEIVRVLYMDWSRGGGGMSNETISDEIKAGTNLRIDTVFRLKGGRAKLHHSAWGTLIGPDPDRKGIYRFRPPDVRQLCAETPSARAKPAGSAHAPRHHRGHGRKPVS